MHRTGWSLPLTLKPLLVLSTVLLLGACAKLDDKMRGYLSSGADVYAVVDGQLMAGEVSLFWDRTGTVTLASMPPVAVAPPTSTSPTSVPVPAPLLVNAVSCAGQLRYTGTGAAAIDLRCSNGLATDLAMVLTGETTGYGYGPVTGGRPGGTASLTIGYEPARAVGYLRAPDGQQVRARTKKPLLELK